MDDVKELEHLLKYLQGVAADSFTFVLAGENRFWILVGISSILIAILLLILSRVEKKMCVEPIKAFIYKAQDETKLLNEIHICSTLSHEMMNVNRCVSLLMESPKAVNVPRDPFGFTPFLNACWAGSLPLVRFMLLNGANVQRKTKDGDSAMYLAVRSLLEEAEPNLKLLSVLDQAGCDINEANYSKYTPLHIAACAGNLDLCKWLVENGADATLKNNSGRTAVDLAQIKGHQSVVQLLSPKISKKKK